jgi:ABC-type amino acid transport substrate-binding protein
LSSRRRRAGIAATTLAWTALVAPSVPAADLPSQLKARGTLRVLTVTTNQRDDFLSTKPGVGFDREVLEGFVSLHKLKLVLVQIPRWDGLIPALIEGRGDVIAGRFTVTEARKKEIDFTQEVFPTRNVAMSRSPHPVVTTLEQLRTEKVGTVKGTSMADAIAAAGVPHSNVDDSFPTGTLPDALRSGKASVVVLGIEHAIQERRTDPKIQLGVFVGPPTSLAYGVRKEDEGLRNALDEHIGNLRRTPTWSRLVVKYFGGGALEILTKARSE